jgi:phosphate acyltransferase
MNIAIDVMGGDFAPAEAISGIQNFLQMPAAAGVQLQLLGPDAEIQPLLQQYNITNCQVVNCSQVVGYHEHPTKAFKEKQDSSIVKGFYMLASNHTQAFISAGNTGAMLVGSMISIKPLPGVIRPSIGTIIPRPEGRTGLLIDVGINSDCKPEQLNQFAIMGAAYATNILGISNPTVGLLNIGEEEGKGNILSKEAYELLKNNTAINFAGNVEGRDILTNKTDVIVCDGFTGNIILKLLESIYPITQEQGISHPYFSRFHFEQYGGTPVLGIEKPVIIGHGVSKAQAFTNMILLAKQIIETQLIDKLSADILKTVN